MKAASSRRMARRSTRGHHPAGSGLPRALSAVPSPGSQPVTVSREVPVTLLAGADGARQVVNHETDEPCYECACCALWARSLDTLGAAMRTHHDERHELPELHPDCLMCALLTGAVHGG
jgi:hypothetical protein